MHPSESCPRTPGARETRAREELEAQVLPLVRRALRTRSGLPALVGWVQRSVAALETESQPDPDQLARSLARLLCDLLLRHEIPGQNSRGAETICGP
jgi:hypothetical protein